ncbi:MAG: DNA repair protein RecN [Pseudomonadales bacterium]|nr:DNA repair protein RecN [Pseudomonadales bacterium]
MLNQLTIHNYALVDSLQIEFAGGMTAITGETGAGKSIILGALGLSLGDRADKDSIRAGTDKADICAEFSTQGLSTARQWLQDNSLQAEEDPDLCLLRRQVSTDGRSRAWINGFPVTLQLLKTMGEMLLDIHSQHEHQSLLQRATQQRLLDEFGGLQNQVAAVQQLYLQWKENREQLVEFSQHAQAMAAEQQLLQYQLEELEQLDLKEDELCALEQEHSALANADSGTLALQNLLTLCSEAEDQTILSALNKAQQLLENLPGKPPRLHNAAELLASATIQVEEATDELRHSLDAFAADPQRLEQINQRIADIQRLARKHRVSPDALPALQQELSARVQGSLDSEANIQRLQEQDSRLQEQYQAQAAQLSKAREKAAAKLSEEISQQLHALGMSGARLEASLHPVKQDLPAAGGLETVEFLVVTNPGQPAKPLIKIASGGELSRISLAIQVITARTSAIPTLVFDEVDVGIGGSVARSVGQLLRELGQRGQIISVTHQALVASQAHHHLFVSKLSSPAPDGQAQTTTRLRLLDQQERVMEIARMLGGESSQGVSAESLAHAGELLGS